MHVLHTGLYTFPKVPTTRKKPFIYSRDVNVCFKGDKGQRVNEILNGVSFTYVLTSPPLSNSLQGHALKYLLEASF